MMRRSRACGRLLRFVLHLLGGIWTIYTLLPRLTRLQKHARVQLWASAALGCLGIKMVVKGSPPAHGPMLLVANHISWADIVVLHATRHCRFVSKDEIAHWPLISTLANAADTIYITRESRRDAMRVVHQMAQCLRDGDVLAIFPEGTTGDGSTLLPFHANLLQAAISANAPVQPVALQFVDTVTGQISFAPCYVGDDTLWQSLWRTVCADNVQAVVQFGAPELPKGRDRRTWAADLRETIGALRGSGA